MSERLSSAARTRLAEAADRLATFVNRLSFEPPVHAVYNPLTYAREPWDAYLNRFAHRGIKALMIGMNPGPWGMAQTGIPFGEIAAVRDWLGIATPIGKPAKEHPKRPVQGFACERSEVSGRRLWGLMQERFASPEAFFAEHFVTNYCPLVFMADTGRNITPNKLPAAEREPLFAACDAFLTILVSELAPDVVIGVGKFAEGRARAALGETGIPVGTMLHPSPASPAANRDWTGTATRQLIELGVWKA